MPTTNHTTSVENLSTDVDNSSHNFLSPLGEKIFLDRYALKDGSKQSLAVGDTVIVCVDLKTGQREIGTVHSLSNGVATIELRDGAMVERAVEHLDKPLEVFPEQMMERVARGIASVETSEEKRAEWERKFRWLLDGWKFVPGGRILTAAGTEQQLTLYNCYVISSPRDSRKGIVDTLSQMMEIMSRGGGVGINISSLRPRHAYVKGVNGRSSGSVSWGALYSFVTGLIEQGGSRRGALMLILNVWHPDVLDFITSKREMGKITNANISVGITDSFMEAVKKDQDWDLVFPDTGDPEYDAVWDGDLEKWKSLGKRVLVHKTVRARDVWNAIIESAWASAEPGVWFMERANQMSNSFYYAPLCSTNPCGEQPLPAWSVCNLGAINLAKFAWDGQNVDWEALRKTVRYAVRFLDNVIDATPYFFEENEKQQKSERRVGLGTMGLAEMLIRLGIRYGSEESVKFIDQLYRLIATEAYLASAEYAEEKGAFPRFDAEKFLQSGFMKTMPDNVRQAIRQKGCRNVTLLTQAPTGCVAPDTLVSTASGLRPMIELGDPHGEQWQPVNHTVHTDVGLRTASHFYVNGYSPVKTIRTRRGFHLTATPNHRIRVLDGEGDYVWRRMDELQIGDVVILKKGTLGEGETVELTSVEQGNRALSDLPTTMTPELAELLGLYMGDGYTKQRGGVHIVVSQQDPDLLECIQGLLQRVWGDRSISVEDRLGCWIIKLTGDYISRFFEANGFAQPKGNNGEGAAGAFIPSKVLRAGRASVAAFLRGLFEAGGSIHRDTITLTSTSPTLISQAQQALLGLGIVSTVRTIPPSPEKFGTRTTYELRMLNRRESEKFVSEVGFASARKRLKAAELGTICDQGDYVSAFTLCEEFYLQSKGLKNDVRQRQEVIGRTRQNGALTPQFVKETVSPHAVLEDTRLAQLVAMDIFLDEVAEIEDDMSPTYDLSVPANETYIANGFISHNTTGTMVGTSTGIEPFYFWTYYRKSRLGKHEEKVKVVEEWQRAHPNEPLPDYFVTAMDLTPEEHVRVEAAIQRWTDSSISKTCNVPQDYTVEQTRELYELMYELGCKGGTIYRDKSRDEQVLNLKETAEEGGEAGVPASSKKPIQKVRPRPYKRRGVTISKATPVGTAHITMNDDDEGNPFEVFLEIGKAGSDIKAMAEAVGRLMSLVLRLASPVTPKERVQEIVNQIRGIGGARHLGFGKDRVMSLPDAVGQALEEHYGVHSNGNGSSHSLLEDETPAAANGKPHYAGADLCPQCGLAVFVRTEGCHTCLSCGYSEC